MFSRCFPIVSKQLTVTNFLFLPPTPTTIFFSLFFSSHKRRRKHRKFLLWKKKGKNPTKASNNHHYMLLLVMEKQWGLNFTGFSHSFAHSLWQRFADKLISSGKIPFSLCIMNENNFLLLSEMPKREKAFLDKSKNKGV